ncbi:MAG: DUF1501 domain-containing protein [Planctomycetota bacterium]|nr:DUF1501 domain-containing protein [Planctomycetota bacterium]MDA1164671.1 DUF1501 domain-containing protein [Planctomycetota bacterium]
MKTEINRRSILQSVAGLGLSFLVPALDLKAAEERGSKREKSLIVLWMAGGPSQLETWDPHVGSTTGGETRAIDTRLKGLQIADLYPQVAEQIGHLNVIRSLMSKEGDHERGTYFVKTGYRPDPVFQHPAVSAILAHERPVDRLEIPSHVSLGGGQWPARGGYLGASFDAFRVFNPGRQITNMRPLVEDARQVQRLASLDVVSQAFSRGRQIQTENTLHQLTVERALTMMSSKQLKAFDLESESQMTRQAYGDSQFGRGCLVARRLIESGVRAVEVTLNGWDTHASNYGGHVTQAGILDPALATLTAELKERDLLDSTVVLCIGEFGRTPTVNPLGGRDHWPKWFSCLVGGGGLTSGQVIGATDPQGKKDADDPIEVKDLYATVMQTLGVDYSHEFITPIGRPIAFSDGTPIERLLR